MKKRLAAVLLSLALCLTALTGPAFARETSFFSSLPAPFDYNDLSLNGTCIAEMDALCDKAAALLTQEDSLVELVEVWNRMTALQTEIDLQHVLTMIRYYQEPAVYGDAYLSMVSGRNAVSSKLLRTQQAILLNEDYGEIIQRSIGHSKSISILSNTPPDDTLLSLLRQESELEVRYQAAAKESPSCVVDGKTWTIRSARDAYLANPAAGDAYLQIYNDLYGIRNASLGQIYLELTALRNRIAQYCGYDNYAAYAQVNVYYRDYTLSEAAAFRESVKRELVPLFRMLSLAVREQVFTDGAEYGALGQDALMDVVEPYLDSLSGELSESFSYMRDCHLIDARFSPTKLSNTFTVALPKYNAAYVNCYRTGGNRDLFDLVHEFGHFNAFIHDVQNGCIDALEVHSQGLEMLYLSFAESLFGQRAQQQSGFELYRMLHSVITGCMYDELQCFAFQTEDLTLDALNRKSASLAAEYALTPLGPEGLDYGWIEISHTFDSPMYYISYATSAFAALEIYLISKLGGIDAAADLYLSFVKYSDGVTGYRGPMIISEMDDPFFPGMIEIFSAVFSQYIYGELCGVPYQDTQSSWAEGDIALLYLLNILNGTSDTSFSPDRTLTRAMAVTALHRAVNKPASSVDAASVFDDVPADTWYSEAVGWAIEAGVTDGTSETTFSPMKPVTCQEFAAMLYRQRFGPGFDYSDESAPEGAADWAADALAWSRDEAVFRGETDAPAPTKELSRAEFAAAIVGAIYD